MLAKITKPPGISIPLRCSHYGPTRRFELLVGQGI
jgi:hypothetical protein